MAEGCRLDVKGQRLADGRSAWQTRCSKKSRRRHARNASAEALVLLFDVHAHRQGWFARPDLGRGDVDQMPRRSISSLKVNNTARVSIWSVLEILCNKKTRSVQQATCLTCRAAILAGPWQPEVTCQTRTCSREGKLGQHHLES